jgi:2-keto-3-deoxy-L-rhamnonate aldolase RhmA
MESSDPSEVEAMVDQEPGSKLARLLAEGQAVFGMFARPQNTDGGRAAAANDETDFIFYSLESGPWDIPTMESFMTAMTEASGEKEPHPVTLRIPPIREDREVALAHISEGIAAGVEGIVFPHVESRADAELAVRSMGSRLWPISPSGDLINILLIEDQVGITAAREIVGTPGVSVAIPGPGDLRRAYEGDMEAVEEAIQTVLAACKEFDVACGITAGVDDIGERLAQGFRLIIVNQPEALSVGLEESGRGG